MDKVYVIRHKVLWSARELGVSRNTVSKYLQTSEPACKPGVAPWPRPLWLFFAGVAMAALVIIMTIPPAGTIQMADKVGH